MAAFMCVCGCVFISSRKNWKMQLILILHHTNNARAAAAQAVEKQRALHIFAADYCTS
jgi:acetone carboxylase gamma subunit